ncbi:MAG: sulfotransferase [Schleiferiaceae bacterium]|nr:sulfotransferase [Schleiferiaceae bacterium]
MRKDKLLKEWFEFNTKYWKALKLRAKLHGHLKDSDVLPEDVLAQAAPVFVLSTGRVGTMLLTRLFELEKGLNIEHEALPEMLYTGKLAYADPSNIEFTKGAFMAGRYEAIRDCQLQNLRYVETNNRLTFFAPAMAALFPNAKFIHLLRHPDSFVSSGIQRNWYTGKTITDEGRIAPAKNSGIERQQDKIAWLWNATNAFIEDFKEGAGKDRTLTVRSEDLFSNTEEAERILNWLDFKADKTSIQKVLNRPVNTSRKKKTQQEYNPDLTPLVEKYYGSLSINSSG